MRESTQQMTNLRERLKLPVPVPDGPGEAVPSPVVEPAPHHAANAHNRRREVDMVRIHYGTESKISLPYAYLATVDMPTPGKLVLEFASRTVTIEGIRLETLMSEIESRYCAFIRASDNPAFESGKEAIIRKVTVTKPE